MKLKTLKVEEKLINYKVFRYICQINMPQTKKGFVLFVEKNFNQQMEEAKLVQKNAEKKGNFNMIKNILKTIQKFQEKHLKIGNKITEKKLIKEQERDGEKINGFKLETRLMNLLEKKEFQDMENANYVEDYPIEKYITQNIQGRILY